jgi:hypothetical protein
VGLELRLMCVHRHRGWYAYTTLSDGQGFVVSGGLTPSSARTGDLWVLEARSS